MNHTALEKLPLASAELQEAITALAVLSQEYEAARKIAQQKVTLASDRLDALINIATKS